jgi:hypothetical protein
MHMWPIPEPPKPVPPPPPRFRPEPIPLPPGFPPKHSQIPPTTAHSGSRIRDLPDSSGHVEPPQPLFSSMWSGPIPPGRGIPPGSSHLQKDRTSSEHEKKPARKAPNDIQIHMPRSDTASFVSDDDYESTMRVISRFMRVRKVFRVGRMCHGNNHENYFRVSPKKEALLLLNEYGRKLVDEARKHEF